MSNDCIFCKIISGEIPAVKIYEDDDVLSFLSIAPINKGHTLVIPKKHITNIFDSDKETFSKVMNVVHKLSPFIKDATDASGINIGINNESSAGQEVFHLHVHIIPRFETDNFSSWKNGTYESDEEMEMFGNLISSLIQ